MKIYAAGRGAGKTYSLAQWVKAGERIDRYPGWSRILLTHSFDEVIRIRREYDLDPHQVYSFNEWRNRHRPAFDPDIEVMADNLDWLITEQLGHIQGAALTGQPWL